MWYSASLLLGSLFLGGAGELEITDIRGTYGYLGATREKKGGLPGESVFFAFNVKNLTINKEGQADFTLFVEVLDPKGEVVFSQGPRNQLVKNYFGGNSVPCHALMMMPLDAEPGDYTLRVVVVDKASGKKASFSGKGKVLPRDFGIIRVGTFGDGKTPRAPVGGVGEILHVQFALLDAGRDKKGMTDVDVSMKILDEKKEPLKAKAQTHSLKEAIPAEEKIIPMQFGLTLDRPGRFTLEITARDNVTGKTAQVNIPLRVLEPE